MTVEQLIEKLKSLNPNDEVVIEVNHDLIVPLDAERVEEGKITTDYYRALPDFDEGARKVIVLRA